MSTNPYDDPAATYRVVVNEEGQHSLWPTFADIPAGWRVVFEENTRDACLKYVIDNWTDMRPNSIKHSHAMAG